MCLCILQGLHGQDGRGGDPGERGYQGAPGEAGLPGLAGAEGKRVGLLYRLKYLSNKNIKGFQNRKNIIFDIFFFKKDKILC